MTGLTYQEEQHLPKSTTAFLTQQEEPPTYAEATGLHNARTEPNSFLPSSILLSSRTIWSSNVNSSQTSNPLYVIHQVSPTAIHLSRGSPQGDARSEHEQNVNTVYAIQRLVVDRFILTQESEGTPGLLPREIYLNASVGPKGVCYSAYAMTSAYEGEEQETQRQWPPEDRHGDTLMLIRSDGRPLGGRRWVFHGPGFEGQGVTVGVEKDPKPDELVKEGSRQRQPELKKLELTESGKILDEGLRELVIACWVARVWKWGDLEGGKKRSDGPSLVQRAKERIKGEHWELDKKGNPVRVGRPSISETIRRYNEEGGPPPIRSKRAFLF